MGKLPRSFRNVLVELSATPKSFVLASHLPDGNGMKGRVSGVKLKAMRSEGLIEYGKNYHQMHYGYRITDLGRAALQSGTGERDDG